MQAQADAEFERVQNLVRAGVLPRRALVEAQNDLLRRGYQETLNRTLLSDTLEQSEIDTMLDAAQGLVRLAREKLNLVTARVEAGAVPAQRLQAAKDETSAAERQAQLAKTRADLVWQMSRMAAAETYLQELEREELAYSFYGFDEYELEVLTEISDMYRYTFGDSPPVSADGDTDLHRSMGLDHTGRIDVSVHPDSDEGTFLTYMLESMGIPYIAFRSAVPGQSTGPHIHVGPPSDRIQPADFPPESN